MKTTAFKYWLPAGMALLSLLSGMPARAQAPQGAEAFASAEASAESRVRVDGYVRAGVFGGENDVRSHYAEGALKLDVAIGADVSAFSEVRYRADGDSDHRFDIREAYVSLRSGAFDFRIGEQIVLWGRADGFNPTNNLTPQDFCVFSPEEDDKRIGNFVVKGVFTPHPLRIEVDWVPAYRPSLFPFIGKSMGDGMGWSNEKRHRWKDQSFGLKIDWEEASFDLSLSYYNGLHKFAGIGYEQGSTEIWLRQEPYRLHVIGADFSTSLGDYGLRGEFACSLPCRGSNALYSVPHKQVEYTVGIDRSWGDFGLIVQYVGKHIPSADDAAEGPPTAGPPVEQMLGRLNRIVFSQHKRWNHSVSIRPSVSLLHETLDVELLGLCQFSTREYFFQPKVSYDVADAVTLAVGGQLFYGPDDRLFGILEKTKNAAFAELKVSF